ncbi:MAG: GNAT family N-acetyltransferase [Planctomycetota bacterium]|nr:GNAT family N-acetyltransferase [Planctomycetota bacterium]
MHTTPSSSSSPFRIDAGATRLPRSVLAPIERAISLTRLGHLHARCRGTPGVEAFLERALAVLDVGHEVRAGLELLPRHGPALVAANHPFGAVEGLVLAHVLRQVRPDVKILVNRVLGRIPEMRELFLPVDLFGGRGAIAENARALRDAIRWLERGGMLAIFPAGEVSSLDLGERSVIDPPWSPSIARMASRAGAPVCPAFFAGRNSALFQVAGLLHPRLRTALLPRELVNKRGTRIDLTFGDPIDPAELASLRDDQERTDWCRLRTYALGAPVRRRARRPRRAQQRIATPVLREEIVPEIAALPPEARLAKSGTLEAWIARAPEIPRTLAEIGRLREVSFRAVGEGTGRARDLDRFDLDYLHLVLWDTGTQEIAGAYRLGATDELGTARRLYTSTLFDYDAGAIESLGPALELGRSFVAPGWQRSYAPLLTLWKGIGEYVARNPRYRRLFGPVSMSADYDLLSRQLVAHWLEASHAHTGLAGHVRGKRPFAWRSVDGLRPERLRALVEGGADLARLVPRIERDEKGIPVLLREYLKLGGKLVALNVDADFEDALDALVVVDLVETAPKLRQRYLGAAGSAALLAHHGQEVA